MKMDAKILMLASLFAVLRASNSEAGPLGSEPLKRSWPSDFDLDLRPSSYNRYETSGVDPKDVVFVAHQEDRLHLGKFGTFVDASHSKSQIIEEGGKVRVSESSEEENIEEIVPEIAPSVQYGDDRDENPDEEESRLFIGREEGQREHDSEERDFPKQGTKDVNDLLDDLDLVEGHRVRDPESPQFPEDQSEERNNVDKNGDAHSLAEKEREMSVIKDLFEGIDDTEQPPAADEYPGSRHRPNEDVGPSESNFGNSGPAERDNPTETRQESRISGPENLYGFCRSKMFTSVLDKQLFNAYCIYRTHSLPRALLNDDLHPIVRNLMYPSRPRVNGIAMSRNALDPSRSRINAALSRNPLYSSRVTSALHGNAPHPYRSRVNAALTRNPLYPTRTKINSALARHTMRMGINPSFISPKASGSYRLGNLEKFSNSQTPSLQTGPRFSNAYNVKVPQYHTRVRGLLQTPQYRATHNLRQYGQQLVPQSSPYNLFPGARTQTEVGRLFASQNRNPVEQNGMTEKWYRGQSSKGRSNVEYSRPLTYYGKGLPIGDNHMSPLSRESHLAPSTNCRARDCKTLPLPITDLTVRGNLPRYFEIRRRQQEKPTYFASNKLNTADQSPNVNEPSAGKNTNLPENIPKVEVSKRIRSLTNKVVNSLYQYRRQRARVMKELRSAIYSLMHKNEKKGSRKAAETLMQLLKTQTAGKRSGNPFPSITFAMRTNAAADLITSNRSNQADNEQDEYNILLSLKTNNAFSKNNRPSSSSNPTRAETVNGIEPLDLGLDSKTNLNENTGSITIKNHENEESIPPNEVSQAKQKASLETALPKNEFSDPKPPEGEIVPDFFTSGNNSLKGVEAGLDKLKSLLIKLNAVV